MTGTSTAEEAERHCERPTRCESAAASAKGGAERGDRSQRDSEFENKGGCGGGWERLKSRRQKADRRRDGSAGQHHKVQGGPATGPTAQCLVGGAVSVVPAGLACRPEWQGRSPWEQVGAAASGGWNGQEGR